jgi:hypothetical protein
LIAGGYPRYEWKHEICFYIFFKTNAFKGDQRLFGFSSKKIIQFRDAIEQKWSGRQVLVRKGQIRISSEVLGT